MNLRDYIAAIKADPDFKGQVVHHQEIPERKPQWAEWPPTLSPILQQALASQGIDRLYTHQAEAVTAALAGENVVVVTPTASGKTLCYNLPVIQRRLDDPSAHALYLFPIKALEQDQIKAFRALIEAAECQMSRPDPIRAEIYDGDTPPHRRKKITLNPPAVVLSNPDMVHAAILPYHANWEAFFRSLRFLVLDELHTYKGVFGSHIVQVLRRLFRIAELYGSRPQIIACSATIQNPGELAERLAGRPFTVKDQSGAPAAGRHFLFVNPMQLSTSTAAARLLRLAVDQDFKTICFTKARKVTELIYTWVTQSRPDLRRAISAYRAGYLPEERREIEQKLFTGELKGVVSTSALEMGIDIGGLDVCLLCGYPGTITTTWQRGGRVGRQDRESLIVLLAQPDALDQYFMKHPEAFFQSSYEAAVVDPKNLPILKEHLVCAAAELPLSADDPHFLQASSAEALRELLQENRLLKSVDEATWHSRRRYPQREVSLRGIGEAWTIFEEPMKPLPEGKKPRVIGSLDGKRAFTEGHQGAIYLHRAQQYQVMRMDLGRKNVFARPVTVNYYTRPRSEKETEILKVRASKPVKNFVVRLGELKVTEWIQGYEKRRISGQERLSVHELDLPPFIFETVGLWIELEDFVPHAIKRLGRDFMGGIHAVEHAAIGLFPLFALCDRDDVGGISTPFHEQVKKSAIFIYDGYPGGIGLAERCFEVIEELLRKTLEVVETCECEDGCPGCVHSSKCGSGNVPLDKQAAVAVLKMLLGLAPELVAPAGPIEEEPPLRIEALPVAKEETQGPRIMVFDLETLRGAEEVGGWNNTELMGLAVGVVWDSVDQEMHSFFEKEAGALVTKLRQADLVVGFNLLSFDYLVLRAYTAFDLRKLPTFDMLVDVFRRLNYRLSLGHLAEKTLGRRKTADGLQSLRWVKEGRMDLVERYCRDDVAITRDLFYHGLEHRKLIFADKQGRLMELSVDWDLEKILQTYGLNMGSGPNVK